MYVFSGVFFQMSPPDLDALFAVADRNLDPAMLANRRFVLGDLVALGKIGVEIVLPVKLIVRTDRAIQRQPRAHGHFNGNAIDDRQRTRQAQTDRTGLAVRRAPEGCPAPAEHFGLRAQLRMHLDPDDNFVDHPQPCSSPRMRSRSRFIASRPASKASRSTDFFESTNSFP